MSRDWIVEWIGRMHADAARTIEAINRPRPLHRPTITAADLLREIRARSTGGETEGGRT